MTEIEGKFLRQTKKAGYVARVIMEILESETNTIELTNITGWENEKVYADWIKGAEIGAEYALRKNIDKNYKICIKKILGTDCDTNPTIIGTATIFGIWDALNLDVNESEIDNLTNLTLESWKKDFKEIPDYEK